jgi:uncharacterized protein (TIGR03083 family)
MSREELLGALQASRDETLAAIDGLSESALTKPGVVEGWSVKDVLEHVATWEAEVLKALGQARLGKRPTINDLTGAEVDEENARWQAAARNKPLERVLADLEAVRQQTIKQVEKLTEADLGEPPKYDWLKNETLEHFIADETYEHEREHTVQILAWKAAGGAGQSEANR